MLALVVKDGLEEYHMAIKRIRAVVKYAMSSPAREWKFMECAVREKIDSKKGLVLDVDTRCNSIYMMLEVACIYQKAFERLALDDKVFKKRFCFKERSIPPVFCCSTSTAGGDVDMQEAGNSATDNNSSGNQNNNKKKAPPPPPVHAP